MQQKKPRCPVRKALSLEKCELQWKLHDGSHESHLQFSRDHVGEYHCVRGNRRFCNQALRFEIENWWNENWLPIFSNGGGNYICYDVKGVFTKQKGQLVEYWNKNNDRNVITPTLTTFLRSLNQYYEKTSINNFDEYFDISEDLIEWKKEFIVNTPIQK